MNTPDLIDLTESLGWVLLHFLWQGAGLAALLWIVLRLSTRCRPQVRYAAAGFAMVLMLAVTSATLWREISTLPGESKPAPMPEAGPVPPAIERGSQPAPVALTTPVSSALPEKTSETSTATIPIPRSEALPTTPREPAAPLWDRLGTALRPWMPWMVGAWALGVLAFSLRLLSGWCIVRKWRRSGAAPERNWTSRFDQLCERMGLRQSVRLLSSGVVAVPMVVGWLKPVILIPASLFAGLTPGQLEAILAHELAHIRRHDFLINLLQNIIEILFFYHPAVWWVSAQLRKEREHCCDDVASSLCGSRLDYARALTALEEIRGPAGVPAGTAISAAGGSLLARIRRLLGRPEEKSTVWPLGFLALAVLALLASLTLLNAAQDAAAPPAENHSGTKQGVGTSKSPPPSYHDMDKSLLKRWQILEERETPISEASVAGLREAIRRCLADPNTAGAAFTADQRKALETFLSWNTGRDEHPADEVGVMLNELLAVHGAPIQLAFNETPTPGRAFNEFKTIDPADLKAWATNRAGTWPMAGGVQLHIYGQLIHAADVSTTAILTWPGQGDLRARHWHTWVAGDAFGNRVPWAVAWETDKPVLWIAVRSINGTKTSANGKPVADRLKRVDFSNANHITEQAFTGWPQDSPPSAEVRAQVSSLMEVPAGGAAAGVIHSWASEGSPERIDLPAVQHIGISVQGDGSLKVHLDTEKPCGVDDLAETLKGLISAWNTKRLAGLAGRKVSQRVKISVPSDYEADAIAKIIQACVAAGCGPALAGNAPPERDANLSSSIVKPRTDGTYTAQVLHWPGRQEVVLFTKRPFTASAEATRHSGAITLPVNTSDKAITIVYTWVEASPGVLDLKAGGYPVSRFDLSRGRVFLVHFDKMEFSAQIFQVPAEVQIPSISSPESLTQAAAAVSAWHAASDDRALWERTRVIVPEDEIKTGQPLDAAAEKIVWGEPSEVGLRLGLGGLTPNLAVPVGQPLPVEQYIRNDGPNPVAFSPTQIFNEGVDGALTRTSDGKVIPHQKGYRWQMFFDRVRLAPGHYIKLDSGPMLTIMAEKDGSSTGAMTMLGHGFSVLPGDYTLQITHGIGQFLGRPVNSEFGDPRNAPGLGEWTGVLKSASVPLRLVDQEGKAAKPGSSEAFDFHELPKSDGPARIEGEFFEMALPAAASDRAREVVLKVPHGKREFYLEFEGSSYGPARGNPVVELELTALLRKKLDETPNTSGLALLEKMITEGRGPIRDCAFRLLGELKAPQTPFDYDDLFHALIHANIQDDEGPKELSAEAQTAGTYFWNLFHESRREWERTRFLLPDDRYQPGEDLTGTPGIVWTLGPEGMSIGVSGPGAGLEWQLEIGKSMPVAVYLRNDGPAAVKLSVPAGHNPVLQISLTDSTGQERRASYRFGTGVTGYQHRNLAPGTGVKVAAVDLESYATAAEAESFEHGEGKEHNPRLSVPAGKYALRLAYRNFQNESFAEEAGSEWTGKLVAQAMDLNVVPAGN